MAFLELHAPKMQPLLNRYASTAYLLKVHDWQLDPDMVDPIWVHEVRQVQYVFVNYI